MVWPPICRVIMDTIVLLPMSFATLRSAFTYQCKSNPKWKSESFPPSTPPPPVTPPPTPHMPPPYPPPHSASRVGVLESHCLMWAGVGIISSHALAWPSSRGYGLPRFVMGLRVWPICFHILARTLELRIRTPRLQPGPSSWGYGLPRFAVAFGFEMPHASTWALELGLRTPALLYCPVSGDYGLPCFGVATEFCDVCGTSDVS